MVRAKQIALGAIFLLALSILLSGIFGVFYSIWNEEPSGSPEQQFSNRFYDFSTIRGGEILPDFSVNDLEGKLYHSRDVIDGHVTLVNLWASWCAPCIKEIPSLQMLERKMKEEKRPFQIVFISMDYPSGSAEMKMLLEQFGLSKLNTFYTQDQGLWAKLEVKALPTSILLSPDGRIQYRMTGDTDWFSPVSIRFLDHFLHLYGSES